MESIWDQHTCVWGRCWIDVDLFLLYDRHCINIDLYRADAGSIYVDIGLVWSRYGINIRAYRVYQFIIIIYCKYYYVVVGSSR